MALKNPTTEALEQKAARVASSTLQAALRSQIGTAFKRRTGMLENTGVRSVFRDGRLDKLTISSPHYSFKLHFGSVKTGKNKGLDRKGGSVRAYTRVVLNKTQRIENYRRSGSRVIAHDKKIDYKAHNHIAKALTSTSALQDLATALGNNRAVQISSQISF